MKPDLFSSFSYKLAYGRAWLFLLIERLIRYGWQPVLVLAVFAVLALIGFFAWLPAWLHFIVLIGFILVLLVTIQQGWRQFSFPSHRHVLARLDEASQFKNHPLTSLDQHLVEQMKEEQTHDMWEEYRRRTLNTITTIKTGWVRPYLSVLDQYGIRVVVFLFLTAGIVFSQTGVWAALKQGVQLTLNQLAGINGQPLKIWIDRPVYTNLPPVYLTVGQNQNPASIHQHSVLKVIWESAVQGNRVTLDGEEVLPKDDLGHHYLVPLEELGKTTVRIFSDWQLVGKWTLEVIADQPPHVAFRDVPYTTQRDSLAIPYYVQDDFGITQLTVVLHDPVSGGEQTEELTLAQNAPKEGDFTAYKNLVSSPLAGREVELSIVAKDAAGNAGVSDILVVALPEKEFKHPTAKELISARKMLLEDPLAQRNQISLNLLQLSQDPTRYLNNSKIGLALRVAHKRLAYDKQGKYVPETAGLLWDIAVDIEDGGFSLAIKQLRQLEDNILDAIARGDYDAINQLLEQYRRTIANLVYQQMQAQMGKEMDPEMLQGLMDMNALSGQDLMGFVDYLQDLARTGQFDTLSQMFAELQNALENMQSANGANQQLQKALTFIKDLANIRDKQQKVLEKTFAIQKEISLERVEKLTQQQVKPQTKIIQELEDYITNLAMDIGITPPIRLPLAASSAKDALLDLKRSDAINATRMQTEVVALLNEALEELKNMIRQSMARGMISLPTGSSLMPGVQVQSDQSIVIPDRGKLNKIDTLIQDLRDKTSDPGRKDLEYDYFHNLLHFF